MSNDRSHSKQLIRSSERVRDLGEVFTPDFLVEKMLDQFPQDAWETNKNWLEPTCGNGQFVLGVLRRKMLHGADVIQALNTTFGADIMQDNITDCHIRIYKEIVSPYASGKNFTTRQWKNFRICVVCLVENNIRYVKDSLVEDFAKWTAFQNKSDRIQTNVKNRIEKLLNKDIKPGGALDKRLHYEISFLTKDSK